MQQKYDLLIKCLLVGDTSAKKSSMIHALRANPNGSIGIDFTKHLVRFDDRIVNLQIWDTAGQERLRAITSSYYRGAHVILCVFSLTNGASFANVPRWLQELDHSAPEGSVVILVGNRCQFQAEREVDSESAQQLADTNGIPYIEVDNSNYDSVLHAFRTGYQHYFGQQAPALQHLQQVQKQRYATFQEELDAFLPSCYEHFDSIHGYLQCLEKLNDMINRARKSPELLPDCFGTKLLLLEKLFNQFIDIVIFDGSMPLCFVQYLDAIGGVMAFPNSLGTNLTLNDKHFEILHSLLERIDKNSKLQAEILAQLDKFCANRSTFYFPQDEYFQTIIIGKFISWYRDKSATEQLKNLRHIPCSSDVMLVPVCSLLDEIIQNMCDELGSPQIIDASVQIVSEYLGIQQHILPRQSPNSATLQLQMLRVLHYALVHPSNRYLRDLTNMVMATDDKLVRQFIDMMLSAQGAKEDPHQYRRRLATASYLIRHFELDHGNVNNVNQNYEERYFQQLIDDFENADKTSERYLQLAVDLLIQFSRVKTENLPQPLEIAAIGLLRSIDTIEENTELMNLLANFVSTHMKGYIVSEILRLRSQKSVVAQNMSDRLLVGLLAEKSATESIEEYRNRLSTAVMLSETNDGMKEHSRARMMRLVAAETDICVVLDNQNASEAFLNQYVADKPQSYFRALCRVYRQYQTAKLAPNDDSLITLVKQYLLAGSDGDEADKALARTVANTSITPLQMATLIKKSTQEELNAFMQNNSSMLLNSILLSIIEFKTISAEDYLRLGQAIVNANKQLEAFNVFSSTLLLSQDAMSDPNTLVLCRTVLTSVNILDAQWVPLLSRAAFNMVTTINPPIDFTETLLLLVEKGANLLQCETLEVGKGKEATNTMLYLIKNQHFDALLAVLQFYKQNPKAIIDTEKDNYYLDQNPLFLAMSNGANGKIIKLMLKLGFSHTVVDACLSEKHDSNIIKQTAALKKNGEALAALYVFKLKEQQPSPASNLLKDVLEEQPGIKPPEDLTQQQAPNL